jgi:hypothetical protein
MLTSQVRLFFIARLRSFKAYWTVARWALLIWGAMNGLGVGLLGQAERMKHRISRRVPRVSGSGSL